MFVDNAMAAAPPSVPWPPLDARFLEVQHRQAAPFPRAVLGDAWWPWIDAHAQTSTGVDYIAQSLLAAVSAVCGGRFVVDVTPQWREPLVLWQALVGAASSGKTPALMARALAEIATISATALPLSWVAEAWRNRPASLRLKSVKMAKTAPLT